jgi:hypothetical protein
MDKIQLSVNVDRDLADAYRVACQLNDLSMSQAIRRHMRDVAEKAGVLEPTDDPFLIGDAHANRDPL